jgi:FAD/FMN-containing dehydrogenase
VTVLAAELDTVLAAELVAAVGPTHVLTDPALTASYETDWTGRYAGRAAAVVRPASTVEVAAVLTACAAAGVAVVPQGGNTGLVAGAVPLGGEVVLSLTRLTDLGPVDGAAAQVTVGAGTRLAAVQAHARAAGLDVGTDLAARASATIGGLVATNAGGLQVLRWGSMRDQLAGLEAVLADGSVVSRLGGLAKDGTGYDLTGLLAGSEGTLAVMTRVRLRLVPALPARAVALVAVRSIAAAQHLLAAVRTLPSLTSAEFFLADGLRLVRAHGGLRAPFAQEHPAYVLLECADRRDPSPDLLAALGDADPVDAVLGVEPGERRRLWAYREGHTEAINAAGVPVKLDVSVPAAAFAGLVEELPALVAGVASGARTVLFGHLAESNLHVNVLSAGAEAEVVSEVVLRRVSALGGSISSEHGVGRAKAAWLQLSRSPAEIAVMRAVKAALDPVGLLNPGVIFPAADPHG